MTEEQSKCLMFIRDYIAQNEFSPSYEEIGAHLGLASKSGVCRLIGSLERAGKIRRIAHSARSVEVIGSRALDRATLAETLTKELEQAHGFDDGEGVVIACTVAECLRTLKAALA